MNPQKFESLEIRDATVKAVEGGWLITMYTKNIGNLDAEISRIEVNGTYIGKDAGLSNAEGLIIPVQSEAEIWVKLANPPYQRGTTATLTIYTTKENQYSQLVIIPEFVFEG